MPPTMFDEPRVVYIELYTSNADTQNYKMGIRGLNDTHYYFTVKRGADCLVRDPISMYSWLLRAEQLGVHLARREALIRLPKGIMTDAGETKLLVPEEFLRTIEGLQGNPVG